MEKITSVDYAEALTVLTMSTNDWPVALFIPDVSQLFEDLVEKCVLRGFGKSEMDSKQSHLVRLFLSLWRKS